MIKLLLTMPLLALLASCPGPKLQPAAISDACQMLNATLYQDGVFQFTDAEIDALSEKNQIKLDAAKRFYRKKCLPVK